MRMCLVSAKNKPSSDKGHVQEPQLHFYLHQQVLSTIENTDASPVATTFLIAKQRKAPPSPSSLGLWSTSSSNSPIRKIKSMPRSRLEVSIDDFSDTSDDTKLLNPGLTNDQFPRPVS
ncbi:hypothetical protein RIR_jg24574.t1 [Rhizophagus irregularis DAOM 181602=DAOM 197198]|nr:hypothetical protein RIR_jg24574.t1 [Rhizophagus irregularis DAOM 181602=DAOM 197198]